MSALRDMATAPRDGSYILAKVGEANDRFGLQVGRWFAIRHEGTTDRGFDLGWAVYPGFGGASDKWFAGWMTLPIGTTDTGSTEGVAIALAALKPFADQYVDYDVPDANVFPDASSLPEINDLTIGDLRRASEARATLTSQPATTDSVRAVELPVGEHQSGSRAQAWLESLSNAEVADRLAGIIATAGHEPERYPSQAACATALRRHVLAIIASWDRRYAPDGVGSGVLIPAECLTMATAADMLDATTDTPEVSAEREAAIARVLEALAKVMPARVQDGPDYAEIYFADGASHSTQAMTMHPADWQELSDAFAAMQEASRGN